MLNTTLVRTNEHLSFDGDSDHRNTELFDELPRIPVSELKHVLSFQIHAHVVSEDGQRSVQIDGRKVAKAASIISTVMMMISISGTTANTEACELALSSTVPPTAI